MVDFHKSDKMIKISGKVDKSNTMALVVNFQLIFISDRYIYILQRQPKQFVACFTAEKTNDLFLMKLESTKKHIHERRPVTHDQSLILTDWLVRSISNELWKNKQCIT